MTTLKIPAVVVDCVMGKLPLFIVIRSVVLSSLLKIEVPKTLCIDHHRSGQHGSQDVQADFFNIR
jgi:hypothetical protein